MSTTPTVTCRTGRPIDTGQAPTFIHTDDDSECDHGRALPLSEQLRTFARVLDGMPEPLIVSTGRRSGFSVHVDDPDTLNTWRVLLSGRIDRRLYEPTPAVHYWVDGQIDGMPVDVVYIDEAEGRLIIRQRQRTADRAAVLAAVSA